MRYARVKKVALYSKQLNSFVKCWVLSGLDGARVHCDRWRVANGILRPALAGAKLRAEV